VVNRRATEDELRLQLAETLPSLELSTSPMESIGRALDPGAGFQGLPTLADESSDCEGRDAATLQLPESAEFRGLQDSGGASANEDATVTLAPASPESANRQDIPRQAPFLLLEELGRGGMGVVHRAHQSALRRTVAVKTLLPDAKNRARGKFIAEACITGQLDHPNIVPVHDLGQSATGEIMMAMKLVDGMSWRELLHPRTAAQKLRLAKTTTDDHLEMLLSVCNAVSFAHSRGILHLDLKPENVMLGDFGEVLVMDWGLAVAFGSVSEDSPVPHASQLAGPCGTPSYMAPELADGDGNSLGPTTDVYLLGAILHEILTGRPPHSGRDIVKVLRAALESEPPQFPQDVPPEIGQICARAMARLNADRPQSVDELAGAIRSYRRHRESTIISQRAQERLTATVARIEGLGELEAETIGNAARSAVEEGLSESLAGFRQSLLLWEGNEDAETGLRLARIRSTEAALLFGDAMHAGALLEGLESQDPDRTRLEGLLEAARSTLAIQRRRAARSETLKRVLFAVGILVAIGSALGYRTVSQERDRANENFNRARRNLSRSFIKEAEKARQTQDLLAAQLFYGRALRYADSEDVRFQLATLKRSSPRHQWSTPGRQGPIRVLKFSDDGTILYSRGSGKQPLRAWHVKTGREVRISRSVPADAADSHRSFPGVSGVLHSASGPGGIHALACDDGRVRLWSAKLQRVTLELRAHEKGALRVALSTDGTLLASGGGDGAVRLWRLSVQEALDDKLSLEESQSMSVKPELLASSVANSTLTRLLYVDPPNSPRSPGQKIRVYALPEAKEIYCSPLIKTLSPILTNAWSCDGQRFAVIPRSTTNLLKRTRDLFLFDFSAPRPLVVRSIKTRKHGATQFPVIAFSEDATLLAYGEDIFTIGLKFAGKGKIRRSTSRFRESTIHVIRLADGSSVAELSGHRGATRALRFSPNSDEIAVGTSAGVVAQYQLVDAELLRSINLWEGKATPKSALVGLAYRADGRVLATLSTDRPSKGQQASKSTVQLWDRASGESLLLLELGQWGRQIELTDDGRHALVALQDRALVIDAIQGKIRYQSERLGSRIRLVPGAVGLVISEKKRGRLAQFRIAGLGLAARPSTEPVDTGLEGDDFEARPKREGRYQRAVPSATPEKLELTTEWNSVDGSALWSALYCFLAVMVFGYLIEFLEERSGVLAGLAAGLFSILGMVALLGVAMFLWQSCSRSRKPTGHSSSDKNRLRRVGLAHSTAASDLKFVLNGLASPDSEMASRARWALSQIVSPRQTQLIAKQLSGQRNAKAIDAVGRLLMDLDPKLGVTALRQVDDSSTGPALEILIEALSDRALEIRLAALKAFLKLGWDVSQAAELVKLLSDPAQSMRKTALEALLRRGKADSSALRSQLSELISNSSTPRNPEQAELRRWLSGPRTR